jgi:hypothetical protein
MPAQSPPDSARRPLLLSLVILLLTIGCTAAAVSALSDADAWLRRLPGLTPVLLYVLVALSGLSIVGLLAMWQWKRWGYAICLLALVAVTGIELYATPPFAHVLRLPAAAGILMVSYSRCRGRFH